MKEPRAYRFSLHYNKPLSKARGEHYWSVHFRKKCYTTNCIKCFCYTESKTNSIQPYVVMQGFAYNVRQNSVDDSIVIY